MSDLFEASAREAYRKQAPLAQRMRPSSFAEFAGQEQLVADGRTLRRMAEADALRSLVLWGPPGTGKTSLARILAAASGRRFVAISAVSSGVAEVKQILREAADALALRQQGTILFIDEIHRFNRAQQDALLAGVEDGTVTLIGATTENPSFEVNAPLLSRVQVLVLEPLSAEALRQILQRALTDAERGLGASALRLAPRAEEALLGLAAGDARALLNLLELAALLAGSRGQSEITRELVLEAAGNRPILYDQHGEEHYNLASAWIKSLRGSDPDAALYYLARMIEGGEDPRFLARRLVIFASEDVGNADPRALPLAVACQQAVAFVGMPEGFYALSQCAIYLAAAPKSDACGSSYQRALDAVRLHGALPVPLHLRNAPTGLMRQLGHGAGYRNPHDDPAGQVVEEYLPERLRGSRFFRPGSRGHERRILARLEALRRRSTSRGPDGAQAPRKSGADR